MKLVVGLGNPGPRYAASRHNVGFRIVDELAGAQGVEILDERFQGLYAEGVVPPRDAGPTLAEPAEPLGFLKPGTFMNRSGDAVACALETLEVDPTRDLLVVYDDLDLPLGRIRLRARGGAGGHNGVASVIERIETKDFARLRFGIGRPVGDDPLSPRSVIDFVLDAFSRDEERLLAQRIPTAAEAAATLLRDGAALAMDRFNRDPDRDPGDAQDPGPRT